MMTPRLIELPKIRGRTSLLVSGRLCGLPAAGRVLPGLVDQIQHDVVRNEVQQQRGHRFVGSNRNPQ